MIDEDRREKIVDVARALADISYKPIAEACRAASADGVLYVPMALLLVTVDGEVIATSITYDDQHPKPDMAAMLRHCADDLDKVIERIEARHE